MDCTIRYARFSSHHYTVPNPLSIDQLFSINKTMCRFISLIQEMPDRKQVSVKTVLFAHNVDGLLFHLPLFHLLFHHLRGDNNSLEDSSLFDNNEGDLSDDKLTFSRLMSLNVIVDLSRLLTHGYSHLYTLGGALPEVRNLSTASIDRRDFRELCVLPQLLAVAPEVRVPHGHR